MPTHKLFLLGLAMLFSVDCHSISHDYKLYFSRSLLTKTSSYEYKFKRIIPKDGAIDSIVTHSSEELMTESPFTFIYLHSGKRIELVGESVYYSDNAGQLLCTLLPPCCANNTIEYNWWLYDLPSDTIRVVCTITIFTPTNVWPTDLLWYALPKEISMSDLQLRSSPTINDTEEDEELRQIGNVIWNAEINGSCYELGYKKDNSHWKLYAVPTTISRTHYILGWSFCDRLRPEYNSPSGENPAE